MTNSEDQLVGLPMDEVPKIDPNGNCNARKGYWVDEDIKQDRRFAGYCRHTEGWGRDDATEGRCKFHNGVTSEQRKAADGGGAEPGSNHAQTHALRADPKNYHLNQPPEEAEWILDVTAAIEDRMRRVRGDIDVLDRVLARRIAIKLHIVSHATEYISREGIIQTIFTEHGSYEAEGPLVQELRRYDNEIVSELRQLGLIDDPESKKADELQVWREVMSEHD